MAKEYRSLFPGEADGAALMCGRLWEELRELYEEIGDWGANEYGALRALDELKERLVEVLPFGPRDE